MRSFIACLAATSRRRSIAAQTLVETLETRLAEIGLLPAARLRSAFAGA
jgi:hypothetical protein